LSPDDTKKNSSAASFSVKDVLNKKSVWTNPLRELSAVIPDGVWLSKLNGTYDRTGARILVVNGSAGSEKMVSDFYTRLENSFHMRTVDMSFAERQKDAVPLLYNFEFKVRLSKGELKESLKAVKKSAARAGKR
jgi:Tfp pilus assembly protein PilN